MARVGYGKQHSVPCFLRGFRLIHFDQCKMAVVHNAEEGCLVPVRNQLNVYFTDK